MAKQQVIVPDIGGAEGAEVIELLVAEGDVVQLDQGLIVLESDKASMEIPSTVAGTVVELLVTEGQELAEGAPVAVIEVAAGGESAATGEDTAVTEEPPAPPAAAAAESAEPVQQATGAAQSQALTVSVPDIGT